LSDTTVPICGVEMAERHTAVIEDVHRIGAIKAFAPERVRWVQEGSSGAAGPDGEGLAAALRRGDGGGRTVAVSGFARAGRGWGAVELAAAGAGSDTVRLTGLRWN